VVASFLLVVSTQGFSETGVLYQQETAQLKEVGRIIGRVQVEGHYERPPPLEVYKNSHFCGSEVPDKSFLVNTEGGLQNVVVTIPGVPPKTAEIQVKKIVLDNNNCAFAPHVQVAQVGSDLLLLNSDPILHDVHARLGSETLFNIGLPPWRQVNKHLTRTGIIAIQCDVLHTWMTAYIMVTSSPYFAVTDQKGQFVIEGVPAGAYGMWVWHEKLGRQIKEVVVTANRTSRVDLIFPCLLC